MPTAPDAAVVDVVEVSVAGWSTAPVSVSAPATTVTTTQTTKTTAQAAKSATETSTASTTAAPGAVAKDIYPGSYCAPLDAFGSYKGATYVCSKTNTEGSPYAGGRARWRKATN